MTECRRDKKIFSFSAPESLWKTSRYHSTKSKGTAFLFVLFIIVMSKKSPNLVIMSTSTTRFMTLAGPTSTPHHWIRSVPYVRPWRTGWTPTLSTWWSYTARSEFRGPPGLFRQTSHFFPRLLDTQMWQRCRNKVASKSELPLIWSYLQLQISYS